MANSIQITFKAGTLDLSAVDFLVFVGSMASNTCDHAQSALRHQMYGVPDGVGYFRRGYLPLFIERRIAPSVRSYVKDTEFREAFRALIKQSKTFAAIDVAILKWLAGYLHVAEFDPNDETSLKRLRRNCLRAAKKPESATELILPWLGDPEYQALLEDSLNSLIQLCNMQLRVRRRAEQLLKISGNMPTSLGYPAARPYTDLWRAHLREMRKRPRMFRQDVAQSRHSFKSLKGDKLK